MMVPTKVFLFAFLCLQGIFAHQDDIFNAGVVKSLQHCIMQKEKMDCLKRKVIEKIDEEIKMNRSIEIADGIIVKRDPKWDEENSVVESQRSFAGMNLNEMLTKKVNDYFKSLVIQFKMNDAGVEEGRRKKQRWLQILVFGAVGIFGLLGHVFVGKLAVMSGAALMIAKIALVISLLSGLKKLTSGDKEHVVYSSDHGHHGGWSRSAVAPDLAYWNQRPRPIIEVGPSLGYSVYEDSFKGDLD